MVDQNDFLSDSLLINILDQIWIQEMYEPHLSAILRALEIEIIVNHDLERIN